jgi:hypothetical protein
MVEEGYSYHETPIEIWLSHTLQKIHKMGGKVKLLTEYYKEKESTSEELINRLDEYNKGVTW